MRFSLRSRFRGAFLGTALGQVFATIALEHTRQTDQALLPAQPNFQSLHPVQVWQARISSSFSGTTAGAQAIAQTHSIIEPQTCSQRSDSPQPTSAIEFLPLMLFCHESPEQLQQFLLPKLAPCSAAQQTEIVTIAAIVSLLLREQFLGSNILGSNILGSNILGSNAPVGTTRFVERLLEESQSVSVEQDHSLTSQLQQISSWLVERPSLSRLSSLPLSPLSAALYSVLKTPASFQLALRHTLSLQPDPTAAALVGLFAGAHLSEAGLPIGWRHALDRYQSTTLQALWSVSSTAELLELADRLWAVWSGAFQPQEWRPSKATVTAVPHLVRPR